MIITAILIYLFVVLMFYVFQRKLLFRPPADGSDYHIYFGRGLHGKVLNQHWSKDAIIYYGGNNEQILDNFRDVFPDHTVYLVPYRGYSGNAGKPTEAGLFEDAEYIFDQVVYRHKNVSVIGRSLGSGVATHIAAVKPVHRLILITPFDSIERVAFDHYPFVPMSLIVRDKFRSYEKAPAIAAPTMIVVACWDRTIEYKRVKSLMKSFNRGVIRSMLFYDCNHTDILEHIEYDDLRKFL